MSLTFFNTITIEPLSVTPDITIWYAKIPEIINSILTGGTYHTCSHVVNEIFKKENFDTPCFNPSELLTINGFKALKKQFEWMAGRVLIKQMMQQFFLPDQPLEQITLGYRSQGAPFVNGQAEIPFSLSHSGRYTAAACSSDKDQTLGIDIEKISKKPGAAFLRTAFSPAELEAMGEDASPSTIFRHWTVKEAYLKYIKKGFNESLHQVEVIEDTIFHRKKKADVTIFSPRLSGGAGEYMLSLVYD